MKYEKRIDKKRRLKDSAEKKPAKDEKLVTDFMSALHTHNRFMALLDFVQDYLGEPAPGR